MICLSILISKQPSRLSSILIQVHSFVANSFKFSEHPGSTCAEHQPVHISDAMAEKVVYIHSKSTSRIPRQVKRNGKFIGTPEEQRFRQSIEESLERLKSQHRDIQLKEMRAIQAVIKEFRLPGGAYDKVEQRRAELDAKIITDSDLHEYVQEESMRFIVSNPAFEPTVFNVEVGHRMQVCIEPSKQSTARTRSHGALRGVTNWSNDGETPRDNQRPPDAGVVQTNLPDVSGNKQPAQDQVDVCGEFEFTRATVSSSNHKPQSALRNLTYLNILPEINRSINR